MHDTLCVCNTLYGSEANAGFFTTFAAFGQESEHLFFKRRSEGNVHRAYNNQQSEDRTDFVFRAFQIGLAFFAPVSFDQHPSSDPDEPGDYQLYMPAFWTGELPRHCSASLVVGQDTKLELQGMMMSPGYGPQSSGVGAGLDDSASNYAPEMVWAGGQGLPVPQVRYWLATGGDDPKPLDIPKGELLEVKLKISEHARGILTTAAGPYQYFQGGEAEGFTFFDTRYYIQVSLWGYREVQQRGQLRAS
jgi:hypothetical protein